MNLMMLLEMSAQGFGAETAFVNGDDALTYSELLDAAVCAGNRLRDDAAQHCAMLDVSSLAFPVGLFASACAGKPFAPLNYRLADADLRALLERISPALLVTDSERAVSIDAPPGIRAIARDDFVRAARSGDGAGTREWPMDPDDTAILLFTSGTTGTPKAAVLRQRHLVSYMFSSVEFGYAVGETALVAVPPYHIAGVVSVISSVYAGRKVVQLPNFSAQEWVRLAAHHDVTTAFLVPTMLGAINDEIEAGGGADLPHLKAISYGGGKMPGPVIERAMELLPQVEFTQAYGLTETSSTVTVLLPRHHRDAMASDDPAVRRRVTSVGQALPGVELQIRDADGKVLGPGERGEIFVRGEQVSGEYVGKGSLLDADGWFPTRDAGELDDEGFLFLEGRSDDVIVRGAENMSPGEIEDVLLRHAAVADAAVVGIPDEKWGEAVAAVVVLREGVRAGVEELQAWVKDSLRSSKVPQQITFASELPYNETGKLLRRVVRAELAG